MPYPHTSHPKNLRFAHGQPRPKHSFFQLRLLRPLHQLLTACLLLTAVAAPAAERILATADSQPVERSLLLQTLQQADVILLGELHDNPHHHAARAWLLENLAARRPLIVAEHLERGRAAAGEGELLPALEAAGFDAKNWRWPLHAPLFEAARRSGSALHGGNVPRALAREIVKQGESALPADIANALDGAPLNATARQTLEQDLLDNHCGQVPASLIPGLALAQRARDAAMTLALAEAAQNGQPVVLLAGNGHVRRDYGVPVLLDKNLPERKHITIGFLETSDTSEPLNAVQQTRFDYVWITDKAERDDPCLNFPKR